MNNAAGLQIGIFWYVCSAVIADSVPVGKGRQTGKFIAHGSHRDHFNRLCALTHEEYLLKSHPYGTFPRGRVVYMPSMSCVLVFADRCLWTVHAKNAIARHFGLRNTFKFSADPLYCCETCTATN